MIGRRILAAPMLSNNAQTVPAPRRAPYYGLIGGGVGACGALTRSPQASGAVKYALPLITVVYRGIMVT